MKMTREELELYANAEIGGPAIGAWPRNKGEKMRPHKGGGGGGDGGAAQREADRQARIKAATETINSVFNNQVQKTGTRTVYDEDGNPYEEQYTYWAAGDPANDRNNLYTNQRQAIYDLNTREVNRQAEQAERQNKFALARAGLAGGSADVDASAELNRRTNEGLLQAGGLADQSAADLKAADERSRANLISMAQSGIDTGTAATMALEGLSANAGNAAAARGGATIGGLFNDMAQAYLVNQAMGSKVNAVNPYAAQQWYGVSSPQEQYSGNVTK